MAGRLEAIYIAPDKGAPVQRKEALQDCGGVLAHVIVGGIIRVGDEVIPPPKKY